MAKMTLRDTSLDLVLSDNDRKLLCAAINSYGDAVGYGEGGSPLAEPANVGFFTVEYAAACLRTAVGHFADPFKPQGEALQRMLDEALRGEADEDNASPRHAALVLQGPEDQDELTADQQAMVVEALYLLQSTLAKAAHDMALTGLGGTSQLLHKRAEAARVLAGRIDGAR